MDEGRRTRHVGPLPRRAGGFRPRGLLAAILVTALAGWGFAFDPVVGAELLLSDAGGRTLIGYGRIDERGLRLQISAETRELRIIVVMPDGSAESYRGTLRDGRLELIADDRPAVDMADALAQDERSLTLAVEGRPDVVVPPRGGVLPDIAGGGSTPDDEDAAAGDAGEDDAGDEAGGDEAADRPDADAPGRAADAPGRSEDAPGRSGDAPGRSEDAPGRSGDAPGRSGDAPGRSEDAPGREGGPGDVGASLRSGVDGVAEDLDTDLEDEGEDQDEGERIDLVDLSDDWP